MKTRYGNWIFASGGDKNGANNVGVPVGRVKISLFIGTAVAATIFATIQVLDAGSADTMRGTLKELRTGNSCSCCRWMFINWWIWISYRSSIWSLNIWHCINGNFLHRR